ncbi:glycosyltransferase [Embleya sp. NPDC127516]|uniref:glycosyltransferase n=1 Tax=Embleya sp. NPDC127516 TaxID=3363990 RepID=UPI0037F46B08
MIRTERCHGPSLPRPVGRPTETTGSTDDTDSTGNAGTINSTGNAGSTGTTATRSTRPRVHDSHPPPRGPTSPLPEVELPATPLARLEHVVGAERLAEVRGALREARERLDGREVWHVSDNPTRGGVAELLRATLPHMRGEGIDTRWATIEGSRAFRALTKALYYRMCGVAAHAHEDPPTPEGGRALYERMSRAAAERLLGVMGRRSVVVLHDHQTAGLIPYLREAGCTVLWQCHIGAPLHAEPAGPAWQFLRRYLSAAHGFIASYDGALPVGLPDVPVRILSPSINPLSPKNLPLRPAVDTSRLMARIGVFREPSGADADPSGGFAFADPLLRHTARIDRHAGALPAGTPLVTQVSRWDRVKDIPGVIEAFTDHVDPDFGAHLLLVGPRAAGDAQAEQVLAECREARERRRNRPGRVHLVEIPTDHPTEHALTINAIQRCSTVVIQKSLAEGFGLTVSEAAWKGRPVIASPVGGIRQQIRHGRSGLLLNHPHDLPGLGAGIDRLLADPAYARELGDNGRRHVRTNFLTDSGVLGFARILCELP